MLLFEIQDHAGRSLIDGEPIEMVMEMFAAIKMFYTELRSRDPEVSQAFRELLKENIDEILDGIQFSEVEKVNIKTQEDAEKFINFIKSNKTDSIEEEDT